MRYLLAALAAWFSVAGSADIIDSNENGFISQHMLVLDVDRQTAYDALVTKITEWWDPAHSYTGDMANFQFDLEPGGCLCETFPEGGGVVHMTVDLIRPGQSIRLRGGLGPLQTMGVAGSMTFDFSDDPNGTRIIYTYTVNGRALAGLAPIVDQVQMGQIQRYVRFIETGNPEMVAE